MKKILLGLVILCMMVGNAFATESITITRRENWGASRVTYGMVQYVSEPYVTGGLTLSASELGLTAVKSFVVAGISSSVYSYAYDYTNGTMQIYYTDGGPGKPAATAATSDYFAVTDDNDAATNGKLLVVGALTNGGAYFGYMDATGVTSAATAFYSLFSAADSVTTIGAVDSVRASFHELAVLIHADTIFFDDDATLASNALMYSGIGLGDMGDIYIPFGDGNFIKIAKKTNSQITVAAALPLYYDENGGLDDKLLSVTNGNADGTFEVSPTYTSLAYYQPLLGGEITTDHTVTVTVHFIAVGY